LNLDYNIVIIFHRKNQIRLI